MAQFGEFSISPNVIFNGCERCGNDMVFVFSRARSLEYDGLVHVTKNDGGYAKLKGLEATYPFGEYVIHTGSLYEIGGRQFADIYLS